MKKFVSIFILILITAGLSACGNQPKYTSEEQYYLNHYYRAKHILILKNDLETGKKKDNAKQTFEVLGEKANLIVAAGDNVTKHFDHLIEEYSEDPDYKNNPNGYFFTDGEMIEEFENAVKNTEIGESTSCESDYGYHIILRLALDETPEIFEEGYQKSNEKESLKDCLVYKQSADSLKDKIKNQTENETENIDPDMPYFLQRLGTVKHEDGTYSFKGIITNINLAYGASVYITTANGRQFSTGSTGLINDLRTEVVWNERQGKYVVLFNEILEGRSPGMMEFFYDKDGNYLGFTY